MTPSTQAPPVHTCHARGCTRVVKPSLLMCYRHWKKVPRDLQTRVWRTYQLGQERSKRPTRAYLEAARAAIEAVAEFERPRQGALL